MIREKLIRLKKEAFALDPALRFFLMAVTFCSFLISMEYGMTRPASSAIFVSLYGAKAFPYAWLATIPLNLFVIFLYDRFLMRLGPLKVFLATASIIVIIHSLCAYLIPSIPALSFFHYIWKDIYILLMFKQLWSLIHTTMDTSKSKFVYGLLFGLGALGGITGSFVPGFFAVQMGSEKILYLAAPVYLLLSIFYYLAYRQTSFKEKPIIEKKETTGAFKMVAQSKFLTCVLLLVVFMQLSIAFADYQFNSYLETHIPTKDLRTEYFGKMTGIINLFYCAFQLLGGFLVIHFLGLKRSHLLVPLFLLGNGLLFLFMPSFAVISYAFVAIKAIDYSFFSPIREMLYIPLKITEKFRAKAVIDVFAYRSAKGLASLLLILLQFFTATKPVFLVTIFSVVTFLAWAAAVVLLFKEYRSVDNYQQMIDESPHGEKSKNHPKTSRDPARSAS